MKILWLSHLVPFPPQGGGVLQRSANLLKTVADAHEVTLLAFNQKDILRIYDPDLNVSLPAALEAMNKICHNVEVVDIGCESKYMGKFRLALSSLLAKWPYSVRWLISDNFKKAVNEALTNNEYNVIWFDTISLAQYRTELKMDQALKVLNHHNVESDMMFRRAKKENNILKKAYFYLEAYKLKVYEKNEVNNFDINVTCSELDLQRIETISPGVITHTIPNGVDTDFFTADSEVAPDPYHLVFIGGMSWYPNRDAMSFFAREVWPLIKERIPGIHMHVVGRSPPEELVELAKGDENYHVHGFVDDVKSIFYKTGIYVCPISDGGGTKLKILDALAMGKPIVAHPLACEGIEVLDGKNVLFAETPEQYVNVINELIRNSSLRTTLAEEGRKLILDKYSYHVIGNELLNLLESRKVIEYIGPAS
jgi:glycosyltransferase involved in cell wall biosynthesis